jgi:drug/metabolite transporter (DMT)-like permease
MNANAIVAVMFVSLMWGVYPILMKILLHKLDVEFVLVLNAVLYFILMMGFGVIMRDKVLGSYHKCSSREYAIAAAMILFTIFIPSIVFVTILSKNESFMVSTLAYTSPLFTAMLAYYFLHEQLTYQSIAGIMLVVSGIVVLLCKKTP